MQTQGAKLSSADVTDAAVTCLCALMWEPHFVNFFLPST